MLAEGAGDGAAETGENSIGGKRAGDVALVEERGDFIALLEAGDATAGGKDFAGRVRAGNDGEGDWERVFALYMSKEGVHDSSTGYQRVSGW